MISEYARPQRKLNRGVLTVATVLLFGLFLFLIVKPAAAQTAVTIPAVQSPPTIDGQCDVPKGEYGIAFTDTFTDVFGTGRVYISHDAANLYVCMTGSVGTLKERFGAVYLDTDNAKEGIAEADDLALHVNIVDGVTSAHHGNGTGDYTPDSSITGWSAAASTANADQAEWQIPLSLAQSQCGASFGMAVYHRWTIDQGVDFGWPNNQFYYEPKSWQEMLVGGQECGVDLTVTKQGSYDQATGLIEYTVEVKNNGVDPANDVKLVDTLPAQAHFVTATPGAPTCAHSGEFADGTLTCDLGTLAPGGATTIKIVVAPLEPGRLINDVTVESKEADANPQDNSARAFVSIDAIVVADLSISKQASVRTATVGQSFTYTVEVKNLGNADAQNVVMTDTLPAGVSYLGATAPADVTCNEAGGVVTCDLGTVPNGGSVLIIIEVRATAAGLQTNQASVRQQSPLDPNPQNNQAAVELTVEGLRGRIAYVFRQDTATAADFKALLEGRGFTVQLVRCPTVVGTNFNPFDAVIIADDTGSLNNWCAAAAGAAHIDSAHKPTIGVGEGGYAYFGQLGMPIGWPNGWHGPMDRVTPTNVAASYWHVPTDFGAPPPNPVGLYGAPVNEVGIYLPSVAGVLPLGLEPAATDHSSLIAEQEDCNQLWGFSGGPTAMTGNGRDLFVNAVVFGLGRRCQQPQQPPADCIALVKRAEPADGTAVNLGDVITYHLAYTVKDNQACAASRALLEDAIPIDTLYVPGSASDGIAPGGDGVLRWNIGPLAPGASGEKKFEVYVTDAQCNNQRRVNNQARVVSSVGVFISNLVSHPVNCPNVVPAGTQPPYAEDEIQIYPYPLVTGHETEVSVRIRNLTGTPQTVNVTMESSPANFGIGIPFGALPTVEPNPRVVTLPPFGIVEVKWHWIPTRSGHYCIRIKIQGANAEPIYTYRNLDVMENLQPGVEDTLPFAVGNPKTTVANILLVVDNTCPGWEAWVNEDQRDQPLVLSNMAPGEERTATLHVIPPTDRPLGTACHIDVQGWIGSELIGGIRKLDVPPVHLPHSNPSWMEKEISVIPNPLVVGQPGQICVQLNNPMPFPRVVSVDFAVADFGAGIGFTPVGNLNNITLPANSLANYCISWTPTPSNNLHRCILITLHQEGFMDQRSQRNIDLVRRPRLVLSEILNLEIPFTIGNTANFTRELRIDPVLVGLPPLFVPKVLPDPPPFLEAGAQQQFTLTFVPVADAQAAGAVDEKLSGYGDSARVEVGLYLDEEEAGGFTVEFAPPVEIYLPIVEK